MEAIRVIKTIENTDLDELTSYLGQKVEIIIFPLPDDMKQPSDNDLEAKRNAFFEIIEHCAGYVKPWTREELYGR